MVKDPLIETWTANLAMNLRYIRQRRGLTQQQLSKLSELPRSTLSQLESGSANPTLAILGRLALALRASIEELLSVPRSLSRHFPKGSLPLETRKGAFIQKLLPDPIPGMEMDRLEIKPGRQLVGSPHSPGTREYLYCESGTLVLWVKGERFALSAGDVVAFQGDLPHSYQNIAEKTAIGFSVVTLAPL